ncbi:hypothetical protein A2U01_0097844, partial [Trifolium medium]|nr:hypothetical protein [Trifolium medium]
MTEDNVQDKLLLLDYDSSNATAYPKVAFQES